MTAKTMTVKNSSFGPVVSATATDPVAASAARAWKRAALRVEKPMR
jgi:hypothetical protein